MLRAVVCCCIANLFRPPRLCLPPDTSSPTPCRQIAAMKVKVGEALGARDMATAVASAIETTLDSERQVRACIAGTPHAYHLVTMASKRSWFVDLCDVYAGPSTSCRSPFFDLFCLQHVCQACNQPSNHPTKNLCRGPTTIQPTNQPTVCVVPATAPDASQSAEERESRYIALVHQLQADIKGLHTEVWTVQYCCHMLRQQYVIN